MIYIVFTCNDGGESGFLVEGVNVSSLLGSSLSDELDSLSDPSELLPELDELLPAVMRPPPVLDALEVYIYTMYND